MGTGMTILLWVAAYLVVSLVVSVLLGKWLRWRDRGQW